MLKGDVDTYLLEGCGRCPLGGTADCKVHLWTDELVVLRSIIRSSELKEEVKWGVPCYTHNGKNVLTLSALKDAATLSFFKGALIHDPKGLLQKPGPNSQAARYLKFNSVQHIEELKQEVELFIDHAIEIEKKGLSLPFKKELEPLPDELQEMFNDDPTFKSAFESLTRGRQRGYIIYFSQPKQSKTRVSRIEKCIPNILNGVGMHDKYRGRR